MTLAFLPARLVASVVCQCQKVNEIKLDSTGDIYADTSISSLEMLWFGVYSEHLPINFTQEELTKNTFGGYDIYCWYSVPLPDTHLIMEVNNQTPEIASKSIGSNWKNLGSDDLRCKSSEPNNCKFEIK